METSVMEELPQVAMAFRNIYRCIYLLPLRTFRTFRPFARLLVNRSLRSLQRRLLGKSQHESRDTIPSGNLLHSYGKSPLLMGKSTISIAHFQ